MLEQAGFAPESLEAQPEKLPEVQPRESRFALLAWLFASVASPVLDRCRRRLSLGLSWVCKVFWRWARARSRSFAAAMLLPPLFFISHCHRLRPRPSHGPHATRPARKPPDQLFAADETVSRTAGRLARAVRRELDALNSGLDGAFSRLRALETALENQIAALDEAGARAEVRGEAIAARLAQESQRLELLSHHLSDAASHAAEIVTSHSAELKATIDSAEGSLRDTARTLSGHFVEVAARATDVMADRSAEMRATIGNAEESLKGSAESLSAHFIEAAARATDVMADRSAQMKTTIDGSEQALKLSAQTMSDRFVEAASRASQTLANRSALLKASIDAAEASLQAMTQTLSDRFTDAAASATESVAGRAAQLKATIETAEGTLKMAAQSLDVQAAGFRAAAPGRRRCAADAAVELDGQAKKIEEVSDAAMARAEFVLARQEKHRAAMSELMARLKEESAAFETALSQQRAGMEAAIGALGGEAKRFETVTGDAERHLDTDHGQCRQPRLAAHRSFAREAEQLKEASEAANALLANLIARRCRTRAPGRRP